EISGIHDDAKPADSTPADAEAPAQAALESAPPSADANAPSTTPVSAEQPAAEAPVKSEADVQGGGVRS
ncbi:MAG: hypothetical protein QOD96_4711, partial [Pseudonocardiales bacterium]|nr:hypothetical protein [Pseudonocardiales bacterium]